MAKIGIDNMIKVAHANVLDQAKSSIETLYRTLYSTHPNFTENYTNLWQVIESASAKRPTSLLLLDYQKSSQPLQWFLCNTLCGMSLYVDRFCGNIQTLATKLSYFESLGINLLHLMPVMESPKNESDGGYAVSNFRKIDTRFGSLTDLQMLQQNMHQKSMYLMMDIVLNHTSNKHNWAQKALKGDKKYQDYFYFFDDRQLPDLLEKTMPEVFPESSPGNFTYINELDKWVMTVFHHYQWDLNYRNPAVFNEMLANIFFYANLGVDVLRIDAPAFLWKEQGTSCQNLPQAHQIIQLIKACVQVATPGMAILAEAIVSPTEIMKYFGEGANETKETDFAYNATQMALQWDALATGDTTVMIAAQAQLLNKPFGTSWLTYTRCHDDIGLAYDDYLIGLAGYSPYEHRRFLKNYYSDNYPDTPAVGALFSVNEKTGDARLSGSLASLCGLEKAIKNNDAAAIDLSINKIALMQATSFFIGGLPMLFYGDEVGYTNDYSYLIDEGKNYDNRWMHRPIIDWQKNENRGSLGTPEYHIFTLTKHLLAIRKKLSVFSDKKNTIWLNTNNKSVAGFMRADETQRVFCIFNYSNQPTNISWHSFKHNGQSPTLLYDHYATLTHTPGYDYEYVTLAPYQFLIAEAQ